MKVTVITERPFHFWKKMLAYAPKPTPHTYFTRCSSFFKAWRMTEAQEMAAASAYWAPNRAFRGLSIPKGWHAAEKAVNVTRKEKHYCCDIIFCVVICRDD